MVYHQSGNQEAEIFRIIGSYGPWQRKVFIVFFYINIIGIYQNFAITFLAPNMDYWCVSPSPMEYIYEGATLSNATSNFSHQCIVDVNDTSMPCTKWEFNTSIYSETIVSEWDLVCDREWLISLSKSIYMVGFMLSVSTFGQISDCVGRFPTIMICYVITCLSSMLSAFSTSYLMFVILRFFSAFGRTGMTTTGFVLLMEIIGPEWRTEMGIIVQIGWSIGFVTLPALAYFVRHWFWFQLAISIPTIPMVCVYWLVPESPRWLMTQRKTAKFFKVISQAAKENGRKINDNDIDSLLLQNFDKNEAKVNAKTILDLLKTPRLAKRTLYVTAIWLVNAFVYYALSYNTNDLGGDPYLNFFISGIIELLSYAILFYCVRKHGRKIPLIIGMMVGGGACAAMMAVPQDMQWLVTVFAMTGRLCITATFGLLYLYTTEMFPTVVRNIAIGSCSTCARIGSITAPFVRELERATHYTVPYGINAGLGIFAGLLAFLLPETKGKKIPDTLEEGEKFGQDEFQEDKRKESPLTNNISNKEVDCKKCVMQLT